MTVLSSSASSSSTSSSTFSMTTMLFDLQAVSVQYGQVDALKNVDLQVFQGQRLALIGANGSGKSTLLRVLNGLITPKNKQTAAQMTGQLQTDTNIRQAMLFQRPHMMRMSALANVALGLWLGGCRWNVAKERALDALARVELVAEAARPAKALSMGQQQRLALARAWAMNPNVLLLDEPTASMDPHAKREVEALMHEFAHQAHAIPMTLVFSSHNLGQVKRLATHVAYLEHGKLLAHLPVDVFFDAEKLVAISPAADAFLKGEFA
jgi:tungstate transport system ATP-binding protein